MSHIQHGAAHDHKVNKDSSCCFFEYDQSFGPALGIIKTEQTLGPLGLRYTPSARSQKSRASALDFLLRAEGVNNYGLVTPRSVLSIYYTVTVD